MIVKEEGVYRLYRDGQPTSDSWYCEVGERIDLVPEKNEEIKFEG